MHAQQDWGFKGSRKILFDYNTVRFKKKKKPFWLTMQRITKPRGLSFLSYQEQRQVCTVHAMSTYRLRLFKRTFYSFLKCWSILKGLMLLFGLLWGLLLWKMDVLIWWQKRSNSSLRLNKINGSFTIPEFHLEQIQKQISEKVLFIKGWFRKSLKSLLRERCDE